MEQTNQQPTTLRECGPLNSLTLFFGSLSHAPDFPGYGDRCGLGLRLSRRITLHNQFQVGTTTIPIAMG